MEAPTHTLEVEAASARFDGASTEAAMLSALERHLGSSLSPAVITVDGETRFEVEAADPGRTVFVQLVANTGEFKSAHRNRVTANLFKLVWIRHALFPRARHVLCVTPSVAPALAPTGWASVATRDLGIEVVLFDPDREAIDTSAGAIARASSSRS
jgi:hypothetical protein